MQEECHMLNRWSQVSVPWGPTQWTHSTGQVLVQTRRQHPNNLRTRLRDTPRAREETHLPGQRRLERLAPSLSLLQGCLMRLDTSATIDYPPVNKFIPRCLPFVTYIYDGRHQFQPCKNVSKPDLPHSWDIFRRVLHRWDCLGGTEIYNPCFANGHFPR